MNKYPKTKVKTGGLLCICAAAFIQTAQAALISYDLNDISNQAGVALDYGETGGILEITDPSDGSGRMDRFYFRFDASNRRINPVNSALSFYVPANDSGYTGSTALSTNTVDYSIYFTNGSLLYNMPTDTIFWIGRTTANTEPWANATTFNDIAYGFKISDQGTLGSADTGDSIELVGIVYSTGSDSVFGQTADQLTNLIPEPATLGLVAASGLGALFIRRIFAI